MTSDAMRRQDDDDGESDGMADVRAKVVVLAPCDQSAAFANFLPDPFVFC